MDNISHEYEETPQYHHEGSLPHYKWVQPNYLNIRWPKAQRLPDPHFEIDPLEFHRQFHNDSHGLRGTHFGQKFLDWGKGPLWDNPRAIKVPLNYRNPEKLLGEWVEVARFKPNEGEVGALLEVFDGNQVAVLFDGEKRVKYLTYDLLYLTEYRGAGGWDNMANLWPVWFYWFLSKGLAVATNYMSAEDWAKAQEHNNPHRIAGKGHFVNEKMQIGTRMMGHAYRYFQIGCLHENKEHVTHQMFDHETRCPDCGWSFRYDSSG